MTFFAAVSVLSYLTPQPYTHLCAAKVPCIRCCAADEDAKLEGDTLKWLDNFVMAHNLCPFARGVRGNVRTVVCRETSILDAVDDEVALLRSVDASAPATTLIVLPALTEFAQLMELQEAAEKRVFADESQAFIQLLAFHPRAEFDTPNDPADVALQSPHPLLHLLRDSDVEAAEEQWHATHGAPPAIQERNAAYLRGLGWQAASAAAAAAVHNDL